MVNILLIVLCMVIGILLRKVKDFPENAPRTLNAYLIYVVLPAISLLHISKLQLSLSLLMPVLVAWVVFPFTWLLFANLGKKYGWERSTIGCLIVCGGLSNTGFVGYPVIEALYGTEGLKLAILADQPGSFIVVSSLAIIVASLFGAERMRKRDISKRMLLFPPFLFFLCAVLLNVAQVEISGAFLTILESFSSTLTPIALIAVGMQLKVKLQDVKDRFLWIGLGHKLILAPLIIFLLYGFILEKRGDEGLIFRVSVMEAAMAPMITSSIIATNFNLKPKLASLLVGIGIPLSAITLAIWYFVLEWM
ncbi:AEC family transporter [Pleomorphovibrio marinus]|uniref:AEC family transporter n=1 Tax=Pleomorphovibrio marinus TaxID=2164132 RepID=UPI000E0CA01F|nr:AEC family transporter [Pleomorphovibrio marinus]